MEKDPGDQAQGATDTLPDQLAVPVERDAAALGEALTAEREAVQWACPPETQDNTGGGGGTLTEQEQVANLEAAGGSAATERAAAAADEAGEQAEDARWAMAPVPAEGEEKELSPPHPASAAAPPPESP